MGNFGYKMSSLGIPGLSNAERVNAPKQKFTNVSVGKQNPYLNDWDRFGKAINQSISTAISGFQAVTSISNAKQTELVNKEKITNAYEVATINNASASLTKFKTKLAASKAIGKGYDPATHLQDLLSVVDDENNKIDNLDIDNNSKEKLKTKVYSLFDSDIKSLSTEVGNNVKTKNIYELNKTTTSAIVQQLNSPKTSLKDILQYTSNQSKAYKANGVSIDSYKLLSEAIPTFYDNKKVLYQRYEEAKDTLNDIVSKGKEVDPGFLTYLNTLTTYKNKYDAREAKKLRDLQAAKKKEAKEFLDSTQGIYIEPTNVSKENTTQAIVKGISSSTFTLDHYNKLESTIKSNFYTQLKDKFIKAGYTSTQINNKLDSITKQYIYGSFKQYLYKNNLDVPVSTLPSSLVGIATEDVKADTLNALNDYKPATVESLYKSNPSIVHSIVSNQMSKDYYNVTSSSKEEFTNNLEAFKAKYSSIDKDILFKKLDPQTRLEYETLLNGTNQEQIMLKLKAIRENDIKTPKIIGDKDAVKSISNLPYDLAEKARKYFAFKSSTGGGYVTRDDVNSYIETHTYKRGVYGFRDSIYFDDNVNNILPNEDDKELGVKIFEDMGYKLDDGYYMESNGHSIFLYNTNGITIAHITNNEFINKINAFKQNKFNSTLSRLQQDKNDTSHWYDNIFK
jgi:hypothetical protein